MNRRHMVLACLTVTGLSLTACSSHSRARSAPTPAQLSAMVLHAADLPSGWTGTAFQAGPTDAANQAAFAACVGDPGAPSARVAEVHSPDFSMGATTISSQAASERSPDDVTRASAALTGPKAPGCYRSLATSGLRSSLPAGSTVGALDVKVTAGSSGGPSNVVATAHVTVTVTVTGQQVTVYVDIAFIASGLVEAEVDFENAGAPLDAALQRQLVHVVAARVATA